MGTRRWLSVTGKGDVDKMNMGADAGRQARVWELLMGAWLSVVSHWKKRC